MNQLLEAYKEHLIIIRSLSPHTIEAYIKDILSFEAFIKKDLLKVTSEDFLSYLATIKNPMTQNRHLSSLNSFYSFAQENFDDVIKPKGSFAKLPQKLPKYLDNDTIMHFLELIDRSTLLGLRDYAMIVFLYATGVRVSELINLTTNDYQKNWIKVRYAKGSKQRVVPIASFAQEALNSYLKERNSKNEYLFLNYKGNQISRISVFKITQKYCGVSPHVFRHSYATSLILGGADLMVVSELLGHSSIETTQIYTHISQAHLKDTIKEYHPLSKDFI